MDLDNSGDSDIRCGTAGDLRIGVWLSIVVFVFEGATVA